MPTCKGQVVNQRPQTPQGEPGKSPSTHMENILVGNVNMIQGSFNSITVYNLIMRIVLSSYHILILKQLSIVVAV